MPEDFAKVSQRDIEFIADFLNKLSIVPKESTESDEKQDGQDVAHHMYIEKVGQYLKDRPLIQPIDRSKHPWHSFFKEHPELEEAGLMVVDEKASLIQAYESLTRSVEEVFSCLNCDTTDKFVLVGNATLSSPNDTAFSVCQMEVPVDDQSCRDDLVRGSILCEDRKEIFYYQVDSSLQDKTVLKGMWLRENDDRSEFVDVTDCKFYNPDTMSLLLSAKDDSNSNSQRVIQLPTSYLEPHLRSHTFSPFKPIAIDGAEFSKENIYSLANQACFRDLDGITAISMSLSGPRKVAALLFKNKKRVRIYDMEVEEDDDDDNEDTDLTGPSGFASDLNTSV